MKELRKRLGRRVLELRTSAGLTQEALAEQLDLHGSYIGLLERGVKTPSLETLCRIADYFDLDLGELLAGGEKAGDEVNRIVKLLQKVPQEDLIRVYQVLRIVYDKK